MRTIDQDRTKRLRDLLDVVKQRGIPASMVASNSGISGGHLNHFKNGKQGLSPERADALEAELTRLLGNAAVERVSLRGLDDVRHALRRELDAHHGGQVPELARRLGVTASDVDRALSGGRVSKELAKKAAGLLEEKPNGIPIATAAPSPTAPASERHRAFVRQMGAEAIAYILAKVTRKMDTNEGG